MSVSRVLVALLFCMCALGLGWASPLQADTKAEDQAAHAAQGHAEIANPVHGNTNNATYNAVDFREDINIFTAVVFLLLLTGLYFAAWRPIMEGLEKREKTIAGNIQAAEQAKLEAQSRLRDYESRLASAADEANKIVAEARKGAEATAARIEAEAQEEAARQRERTAAEIDAAKRVALGELATKSTDVAMALAQRIIGREVKAADHQKLIQDMLAQLPSKN